MLIIAIMIFLYSQKMKI